MVFCLFFFVAAELQGQQQQQHSSNIRSITMVPLTIMRTEKAKTLTSEHTYVVAREDLEEVSRTSLISSCYVHTASSFHRSRRTSHRSSSSSRRRRSCRGRHRGHRGRRRHTCQCIQMRTDTHPPWQHKLGLVAHRIIIHIGIIKHYNRSKPDLFGTPRSGRAMRKMFSEP